MRVKSIRGRLLLWLAFLLACLLAGFGVTAWQFQRIHHFSQIDNDLAQRVAALSEDARQRGPAGPPGGLPPDEGFGQRRSPPPRGGLPPDEDFGQRRPPFPPSESAGGPEGPRDRFVQLTAPTLALFNAADTNGFYYEFWSRERELLQKSHNAPASVTFPDRPAVRAGYELRTHGPFREAWRFTERGEYALAGRNITADLAAMNRFALLLFFAGAGVLALGLAGAGWIATRALRPVEGISVAAHRISASNLSERINTADIDSELGNLAATLNSAFAQLEAAFARQRQFTADAAHELRTPVSVMLTHAQNGLAGACASEEHREAFEACQRAAQRMRHLIESLLELVQLDTGQETIRRQPMDLARVAADCVELVRPLAALDRLAIHAELAPCQYDGDPQRLAQVISNLLANAIHYNKPGGEIWIRTEAQDGAAVLAVRDTGRGIAAEDLPHIFERFYRADKSRSTERFYRVDKSRQTAGRGLGLAISKAIILAHGGSIQAESIQDEGSEFQVVLPHVHS
jgi:signal transduction histidine kinase